MLTAAPAMKLEREPEPESGSPVVDGIAIGKAVVWASHRARRGVPGTAAEEHGRLRRAILHATRGVEDLIRQLGPAEAELFGPEVAILAELGPLLLARVEHGETAEQAIHEATSRVTTDLLLDARARLLDGLGNDQRSVESLLEGRAGDRVLVTESLTPSLVATLPPRIVGIVAASNGVSQSGGEYNSHAVILARGRGIPLAFMRPNAVLAIADDDTLVLDTTGDVAAVWVAPDASVVADAERRRDDWVRERAQEEARIADAPLEHLGVEVHVNIGSVHERPPPSADGIGLLRTELVFAAHARAPSEVEQFCALRAIAAPIGAAPVVVRLFDAGGDKPLAWLPPPESSPLARGVELLFMHPTVLGTQLRAIERAAEHLGARILLPLVTGARDVERIRDLTHGKVAVGAMIETPAAVERIAEIATAADFICIGTNDLFALVTGLDRADATLSFDSRALRMIERVVETSHAHARKVCVCGEMAGDPRGARILVGLGVDAISVATARFAKVKHSLRDVSLDACRSIARDAMG
ncbi:MAG TPA: putative PEP-binding protein [Polyangiaceae bacterium]|nr:putative PEP-binding protein [Polyangiaceae bacterium]